MRSGHAMIGIVGFGVLLDGWLRGFGVGKRAVMLGLGDEVEEV